MLPKGPQNVTLWVARSRSRSLFTRSKSRFATASGSHTFAVAASSSGIGVRPVATSSRNPLRSVSAVGFNAAKTKALVYIRLRGSGQIHLMERRDGQWVGFKGGQRCGWIA